MVSFCLQGVFHTRSHKCTISDISSVFCSPLPPFSLSLPLSAGGLSLSQCVICEVDEAKKSSRIFCHPIRGVIQCAQECRQCSRQKPANSGPKSSTFTPPTMLSASHVLALHVTRKNKRVANRFALMSRLAAARPHVF